MEKVTPADQIVYQHLVHRSHTNAIFSRCDFKMQCGTGSLHRNHANDRPITSIAPMKYSHCPDCAGAMQRLPTCSVYGDEAIERFGLWGGGWMTLARLLRCQPWGTSGIDNVPLARPPGARWYLPWRFGRWRGVNAP
jgi:uncharacterized protein